MNAPLSAFSLLLLLFTASAEAIISAGAPRDRATGEQLSIERGILTGSRDLYWKVQALPAGDYYLHLQLESGKRSGVEFLRAPLLYLNGRAVAFESAAPLRKAKNGVFATTAQSAKKIPLKNGDILMLRRNLPGKILGLSFSRKPLESAPVDIDALGTSLHQNLFRITPEWKDGTFAVNLFSLLPGKVPREVETVILDYFQNEVGSNKTVTDKETFRMETAYRHGGSDRYRAIVRISENGQVVAEKVFSKLSDCAAYPHKKMWLLDGWEITQVRDDGTYASRTLSAAPPPGSRWSRITLPALYQANVAYLRRKLRIPEHFRGKRYFLHFSRILYEADIYVNGRKAGSVLPGESYAPCTVELTGQIQDSAENTLLVAVRGKAALLDEKDLRKPKISTASVPGRVQGIDEVFLTATPEQKIGPVLIDTSFQKKTITVRAEIPAGFHLENRVRLAGRELLKFRESAEWKNPPLWGPVSFPLLELVSELKNARGETVDRKHTRFGFREIRAEKTELIWNGRKVRFSARAMASTWSSWDFPSRHRRDSIRASIREMKRQGTMMARHIYNSHNFADIADEEGFVITQGTSTPSRKTPEYLANDAIWKNLESNTSLMIRELYNHPSIFTWYIANEMFALSYETNFRRISSLFRAAQRADRSRLIECGADLDLKGLSNVCSVHYPIDCGITEYDHTDLPDVLYWRPLNRFLKTGEPFPAGPVKVVGCVNSFSPGRFGEKPLILNESGWNMLHKPPFGYSKFYGDRPYASAAALQKSHRDLLRTIYRGSRDIEAAVITPWRHYTTDPIAEMLPPLDACLIQQYHSFFPGEEIRFDVNLIHDPFRRESLEWFWSLRQDGREIAGERKRLTFDFSETVREAIRIKAGTPGSYTLVYGFTGRLEKTHPIRIVRKENIASDKIIRAEENPDARKQELCDYVKNGGVVIFLPRETLPQWLPLELKLSTRSASVNFTFRPKHPVLNGIQEDELSFARPNHIAGSRYFVKPARGNFRSIIDAGGSNGLDYCGLLELPFGKGSFILSRLTLDAEHDPVAQKLLKNMLSYRPRNALAKAGLIAPPQSAFGDALKKRGASVETATPETAEKYSVLLIDAARKFSPRELEQLRHFKGRMLVHAPGKEFGVTASPQIPPSYEGRALRLGNHPFTEGLTNHDLFRLKAPLNENLNLYFNDSGNILAPLGKQEIISGAQPLLYPAFLAVRGNVLFSFLELAEDHPDVQRTTDRVISTILTNLGVKIIPELRKRIPENLSCTPLDMRSVLNRNFADEKAGDGIGGWTDQGPQNDLREFREQGEITVKGIPFRIEQPRGCLVLSSRYMKGGADSAVLPVNSAIDALFWLHTCAYTNKKQHYSVLIHYENGAQYEIKMSGAVNLRDWGSSIPDEPFGYETDTLTGHALSVPQTRFGKAHIYRTTWINPQPETPVRAIEFRSEKNAVPVILAVTIGKCASPVSLTQADDRTDWIAKALEFRKAGNLQAAIRAYEQAYRRTPGNRGLLQSMGACYEALNDYRNAERTYLRALENDINQPEIFSALERVRNNMKKEKKK